MPDSLSLPDAVGGVTASDAMGALDGVVLSSALVGTVTGLLPDAAGLTAGAGTGTVTFVSPTTYFTSYPPGLVPHPRVEVSFLM